MLTLNSHKSINSLKKTSDFYTDIGKSHFSSFVQQLQYFNNMEEDQVCEKDCFFKGRTSKC